MSIRYLLNTVGSEPTEEQLLCHGFKWPLTGVFWYDTIFCDDLWFYPSKRDLFFKYFGWKENTSKRDEYRGLIFRAYGTKIYKDKPKEADIVETVEPKECGMCKCYRGDIAYYTKKIEKLEGDIRDAAFVISKISDDGDVAIGLAKTLGIGDWHQYEEMEV